MPKSKLYAWKCSCGTNMKWLGKLKGGGGFELDILENTILR